MQKLIDEDMIDICIEEGAGIFGFILCWLCHYGININVLRAKLGIIFSGDQEKKSCKIFLTIEF